VTALTIAVLLLGVAFAMSGGWILHSSGRRRRVGLSVVLVGLLLAASVAAGLGSTSTLAESLWLTASMIAFPVVIFLFPDGRVGGQTGGVVFVLIVATGALAVVYPAEFGRSGVSGLVLYVLLLSWAWWRYDHSDDQDRQALLWLALAAGGGGLIGGVAVFMADNTAGVIVLVLAGSSVPVALAIGMTRPEVADIRALIVSVVVYAVTAIVLVSVFVGSASTIELLLGRSPSIGATAVIAMVCAGGFHPTRVVLRGVVDQLLFGDRPDPLEAASRVGESIADDPVHALRALREALLLPYAALVREDQVVASSGTATTETSRMSLRLGGREVGSLLVALRPGELRLPRQDEDVLRIVAPALAQTLHARALSEQLHESRAGVIAAVEEERRRLRRDLHDGLGPTLTGVAYTADAARNHVRTDPAAAEALLAELRGDTSHAIAEIRRVVEGLRPPALDELGLVGALDQRTNNLRAADGRNLDVHIQALSPMPPLPAAVEVAAYRIVTEALTNVARHADSPTASVRLRVTATDLVIDVRDSGRGGGPWTAGVGLSSMRERVEQMGGRFEASADRGGHVLASLPLVPRAPAVPMR